VAYSGYIENDGTGVRVKANITGELDMWLEADGTGIKIRSSELNPTFPAEANTLLGSGAYGWTGEYVPAFNLIAWEALRNTDLATIHVENNYPYVSRGVSRLGGLVGGGTTVVNVNGWPVNYGEDPTSPWTHSDAVLNGVFQDILEIDVVIIDPLQVGA
jgi:hypothetical protein